MIQRKDKQLVLKKGLSKRRYLTKRKFIAVDKLVFQEEVFIFPIFV